MAILCRPHIKVYALLPPPIAPTTPGDGDSEIDVANWHWVHCLTLPLETLNSLKFSRRPYKWIRYAMGVVLGAEGVLSTSSRNPIQVDGVDYEAAAVCLPAASVSELSLYYHTSEEERRRMFPVDPQIGSGHSESNACSDSSFSVPSDGRESFNDEIAQRDGGRCVVTGLSEEYCTPAHLLAYSKDDTYISTYTRHRSRDPTGKDVIEDINSVRNGVLLCRSLHGVLGTEISFLPTPNFAMSTTDIAPNADPAEKRWSFNLFTQARADNAYFPPSGSAAQIHDTPQCPPAILFDAVYAGTVQHHFGTQALKDNISVVYNDAFYPAGRAPVIDEDERRAAIATWQMRVE